MESPFVPDYLGEGTAWIPPQGKMVFTSEDPILAKDTRFEDRGQAKIMDISFAEDPKMFMRLQSWDEETAPGPIHEGFDSFLKMAEGKKIKITFEVL